MRNHPLLLGLWLLSSAIPATATAQGKPPGAEAWRTAIGMAVGYTRMHAQGLGLVIDLTIFSAPVVGGAAGVGTPPTLFAILPLGRRLAIEPGLDVHRAQSGGNTNFNGNLSLRVDYAVHRGWYAGAGGNVQYVQSTGQKGIGIAGAGLAWGYRFHVAGPVGGRFELNYTVFKQRSGFPFATSTLGLMFGAVLPLR